MQPELVDALADEVVQSIKSALAPVTARIEALERRSIEAMLERIAVLEHRVGAGEQKGVLVAGPTGEKGLTGDIGPQGPAGEKGDPGERGADGKDADTSVVDGLKAEVLNLKFEISQMKAAAEKVNPQALIESAITKAIAGLPAPKDGQDGKDGQSVDPAVLESLVTSQVEKAVSALPAPKDGRSVTVDDVAPLIGAEVAKAIAGLPVPKDGVGLTGVLVDRAGHLIVTLSDGTTKDVGLVVGKDVDLADVQRVVTEAVAQIPRPKDGAPGKDGRDGAIENVKLAQIDDRTWQWQFKNGDPVDGGLMKFEGMVRYCNIYDSARAYEVGDGVTHSGSYWIAKAASQGQQPGTNAGAPFWQLVVKRGADGKQGPPGTKGMDGKDGSPGKDGNRY